MSEAFIGEIRMFAGNFAPLHWALCDGALLPITQNETLFSLLGTIYAGDSRTTFGLPDLRGRLPVHQGQGPALTGREIGSRFGMEQVSLSLNQIPSHNHELRVSTENADASSPAGKVFAFMPDEKYGATEPLVQMAAGAIEKSGNGDPHSNLMPTQCLNFIISLQGIYPSRN